MHCIGPEGYYFESGVRCRYITCLGQFSVFVTEINRFRIYNHIIYFQRSLERLVKNWLFWDIINLMCTLLILTATDGSLPPM